MLLETILLSSRFQPRVPNLESLQIQGNGFLLSFETSNVTKVNLNMVNQSWLDVYSFLCISQSFPLKDICFLSQHKLAMDW